MDNLDFLYTRKFRMDNYPYYWIAMNFKMYTLTLEITAREDINE